MGEHLERAKRESERHCEAGGASTVNSPDERTIPALLAGILNALVSIAETLDQDSFDRASRR